MPDTDSDTDGVADCVDNYPYLWNPNQEEVAQKDNNQGIGSGGKTEPTTCSPINFSTGNKYKRQTDLLLSGPGKPFGFIRFYNSQNQEQGVLGFGWTATFTDRITISGSEITLIQSDGRHVKFVDNGQGKFISLADKIRVIEPDGEGYRLLEPEGLRMSFNAGGNLVAIRDLNGNTQMVTYTDGRIGSVTDTFGRYLIFIYNSTGRLSALLTPAGQYLYTYDAPGNLARVDNPDTTFKTYIYGDPNDAHNLTGIVDENNVRSMTTVYDNLDRAIRSESAGGFKRSDIEYVSDNVRNVIDSRGNTTTFQLAVSHGIGRIESSTGTGCSNCAASPGESYQLNDRLRVDSETDAEGAATNYSYDTRGNMLTKTEAVGTLQERTLSYTWHPNLSKIATVTRESVANPGQTTVTAFDYDTAGNLLRTTAAGYEGTNPVTRTIAYTYNASGRLMAVDGPRTDVADVTMFTYYPNDSTQGLNRGQLQKVTNAIGQETLYANYNAWSKPQSVTDINGVETTFVFDTAGRVESSAKDGKTTSFDHDNVGRLLTITLPGGRTITYSYTAAGLAETITDNTGNYIRYTYDTEGNRTREGIHDDAGTLAKYTEFTFDEFNRLEQVIYPDNHFENYTWDQNDKLITATDASGRTVFHDYDPLNRLKSVIQPGNLITTYGYDSHDNLTMVTDAETHTTVFAFSDLGPALSENSPDAGLKTYTYDKAGNLSSKTDANGITVYSTYDMLNRLTHIAYPDSAQNIAYTYDAGTYGKGRLTGISDPSGDTVYTYDARGNLTADTRTIGGVAYTTTYRYDVAGTLTGMTYPDGRGVSYDLDSAGRVSRVTTTQDGISRILADNIYYLPFGPVAGLSYGNGLNQIRSFDLLYRPVAISAESVYDVEFTMDAVGNITGISDNLDAAKIQMFGYDDLYRITDAVGGYGTIDYTYDNIGNRLTKTHDGITESYAYHPGTSLLADVNGTAFAYDANGNTIVKDSHDLTYNQNNRLVRVIDNGLLAGEYVYNALGQRAIKRSGRDTTIYLYDLHGNLITEAQSDGSIIAEYLYLNGNRLAVIRANNKIEAFIDIDPDTLILSSNGNWITAHIELPEGYDISDIDPQTITLNGTVYVEKFNIGDHDEDGIPDLMVKFDRGQVCDILNTGDAVEIVIEGEGDGFRFFGVDFIRVIDKGHKKHKSSLFFDFAGKALDDSLVRLSAELNVDPDPVRFTGKPPGHKQEPVLLASLFDITGILARSVVAQIPEKKIYYYVNDHLGTPQRIVDENNNVVWSADYQPFGSVNAAVSDLGNNFRFAGQYYDQETGLHYNYHRYYDPKAGRYLTPDPIGLTAGINLFSYVLNNSVNFIDPFGLETLYERIHPSFLNDLRKFNPIEHHLFTKYTKGINTDLWTDDVRWLELSWKNFNPYARQEAEDMIAKGCEEAFKSIYSPESWVGKYFGGVVGLLFGTYSDIGTADSAASLVEITREATNIMIIGPAVVNEKTWQEAFGRSYTPGLR